MSADRKPCGGRGADSVSPMEEGNVEEEVDAEEFEKRAQDMEVLEEECGKRTAMKVKDPKMPSKEQILEHEMSGHLPMRDWCTHCVKGRGMEAPHRRGGDGAQVPEVSIDFFFMGDPGEEQTWTMLAVKERGTRMMMASATPTKSVGNFIAKRVAGKSGVSKAT